MSHLVSWARELQALAQAGLYYVSDPYDEERFTRIREISAEMMASAAGMDLEAVTDLFCGDTGYATPKVDTRAAIVEDDKILLVQESDGRWALPGGWCDENLSPVANTVKEAKEEAGLDIEVTRLVALHDRDRHNEQTYAYGVVKIFFLAQSLGGQFVPNTETIDARFFAADEIPVMAGEKTTRDQVLMCLDAASDPNWAPILE